MQPLKFVSVTSENLSEFKHLHECIFPTTFPRQFYKEAEAPKQLGLYQIAFIEAKSVGVLSVGQLKDSLYIYSLGCRVFNRRRKIGSHLLENALEFARNQNIGKISLHVQEGNEAALEFYQKHGFNVIERVPGYYRRLQPSDGFLLSKAL